MFKRAVNITLVFVFAASSVFGSSVIAPLYVAMHVNDHHKGGFVPHTHTNDHEPLSEHSHADNNEEGAHDELPIVSSLLGTDDGNSSDPEHSHELRAAPDFFLKRQIGKIEMFAVDTDKHLPYMSRLNSHDFLSRLFRPPKLV